MFWFSNQDSSSDPKVKKAGRTVLPDHLAGGPHGLGDPDDRTLRKVEWDALIPKIIRERSRQEKCIKEVEEFGKCCKASSVFMVFKCRKENKVMFQCLEKWWNNEEFRNECKEQYLRERSEYRRTGLTKKMKEKMKTQQVV